MSIRYDELDEYMKNFNQEVHIAFDKYQQYFFTDKAKIVDAYNPEKVTQIDIAKNFINRVNQINKIIFENKFFMNYDVIKERLFMSDVQYEIYCTQIPTNIGFDFMGYYRNFEELFANIRSIFQKVLSEINFISDMEREYFINKLICTLIEFFDENLHIEKIYIFQPVDIDGEMFFYEYD